MVAWSRPWVSSSQDVGWPPPDRRRRTRPRRPRSASPDIGPSAASPRSCAGRDAPRRRPCTRRPPRATASRRSDPCTRSGACRPSRAGTSPPTRTSASAARRRRPSSRPWPRRREERAVVVAARAGGGGAGVQGRPAADAEGLGVFGRLRGRWRRGVGRRFARLVRARLGGAPPGRTARRSPRWPGRRARRPIRCGGVPGAAGPRSAATTRATVEDGDEGEGRARRMARQGTGVRPTRAVAASRTSAGSTPNTSRIRSSVRTSRRRAVGDEPAAVDDDEAREEVRREAEVVEDGDHRRAVALVEVAQQLHRLDLVAEVEVDRRLVEQQDRRGLRDRQGEQDQLALARARARGRRGP